MPTFTSVLLRKTTLKTGNNSIIAQNSAIAGQQPDNNKQSEEKPVYSLEFVWSVTTTNSCKHL